MASCDISKCMSSKEKLVFLYRFQWKPPTNYYDIYDTKSTTRESLVTHLTKINHPRVRGMTSDCNRSTEAWKYVRLSTLLPNPLPTRPQCSEIPISRGHFSLNNLRKTPIPHPWRRAMGAFREFEVWPEFYLRSYCAVCNNVLFTVIYRESMALWSPGHWQPTKFQLPALCVSWRDKKIWIYYNVSLKMVKGYRLYKLYDKAFSIKYAPVIKSITLVNHYFRNSLISYSVCDLSDICN